MQFLKDLAVKITLAGFFLLMLTAYGMAKNPAEVAGTRQVVLKSQAGRSIKLDLATTPEERQKGLSGEEDLPEDHGKFFVFDQEDTHHIWMKDMKFDLDIAWISAEGEVVHVEEDVPAGPGEEEHPPVYSNDEPAKYVLEMKAGSFEKYGIAEGEKLEVDRISDLARSDAA